MRSTDDAGGNAAPAISAVTTSAGLGAPARASPTTASRPAALTTASTSSMRAPSASISRPAAGAPSPLPSASAPAVAPATPNEPVSARSSSTIASPLIPIGRRASSEAPNRRPTCGVRRISRYRRIERATIRTPSDALSATGSPSRTRPGSATSHHSPNVTSRFPRSSASAASTGVSVRPSSGSRVVTTQRGTGSSPRNSTAPTAISRPGQPCSSQAPTPSIATVMRKRRASGTLPSSAGASAASDARDISVTGASSASRSPSSRANSCTARPRWSETASDSAPSTSRPGIGRPA